MLPDRIFSAFAEIVEIVSFYIEPLRHATSTEQTWLIFRASLSSCVGIYDTRAAAVAAAIPMAEYCVVSGKSARICVRDKTGDPWSTVFETR